MKNTKLNKIATIAVATMFTTGITLWSLTFSEEFLAVLFASLILAGLFNLIIDTLQGERREIDYTKNWTKWIASLFFNQISHTILFMLMLMYAISTLQGDLRDYIAYAVVIMILSRLLISDFSPYVFGYYSVQRKIHALDRDLDFIEFSNRTPAYNNKKDAM